MATQDSTDQQRKTQLAKLRGAADQALLVEQTLREVIQIAESEPPVEELVRIQKTDGGEIRAYLIPNANLAEDYGLDCSGDLKSVAKLLDQAYWDIYSFSYLLGQIDPSSQVPGALLSSISVKVEESVEILHRLSTFLGSISPVPTPA